jgi:hypothetical protein
MAIGKRRLNDIFLQPAVTQPEQVGAEIAETESWIVVLNGGGEPIAVIPPDVTQRGDDRSLGDLVGRQPPILVADAAAPATEVTEHAANLDCFEESFIVVVGPGGVEGTDRGAVRGVVSLQDLNRQMGVTYRAGLQALPGPYHIGPAMRRCQYEELTVLCGFTEAFYTKPFHMPQCNNPRSLLPHSFRW